MMISSVTTMHFLVEIISTLNVIKSTLKDHIVLNTRKPVFRVCVHQRRRSEHEFAQSDMHPFFCLLESIISELVVAFLNFFKKLVVSPYFTDLSIRSLPTK